MRPMYTMGSGDPHASLEEVVRDLRDLLEHSQQDPVRVPRCVLRAVIGRLEHHEATRPGPAGPESFRPTDGPDPRW